MKHFHVIDEMDVERGTGYVISLTKNLVPVRDYGFVVDVSTLWQSESKQRPAK